MARVSRKSEVNHSLSRTLAATLGSIPLALAWGVAVTFALPLGENQRLLLGSYSVFPVWVSISCWIFLAPSGRRAWLNLAVGMAVAVLAVVAALALGRGTASFGTSA